MNHLVMKANSILSNKNFEYAFCGGHAIDLFLGYESRKHSDIDVLAYWKDRDSIIIYMKALGFSVYEMLGNGKAHLIKDIYKQQRMKRNIFCCKDDCELVDITDTNDKEIYNIDFHHTGQSKLNFLEFLFNDKTEKEFLYARNHNIRRNLSDAILQKNNVPYLAPEICLLYKSTDVERDNYQQDYNLSMPLMSKEQRDWLNAALDVIYSGKHIWRT